MSHGSSSPSRLRLAPDASACADARHWAAREVRRLHVTSPGLVGDAELVVSELVANAVQHGAPPFLLTLSPDGTDLVVTVSDSGPAPHRFGARPADPTAAHDRGLAIVAALTRSWGIRVSRPGPGTEVWCRLGGLGSEAA